ncbi:hypothetical protein B566_EDAN002024 [Ephemera danica]|nr:hypothetical protein B566_EDAN002024 [Ephemera danica]
MPKRKANPVKLSDLQRREESYCFGGTHNNVPVAAEEPNVQPLKSPKSKLTASPNKRNFIAPTNAKYVNEIDRVKITSIVGKEIENLIRDQIWSVPIQRQLDTSQSYYLGDITFKIHDHAIGFGEDLPREQSTIKLFVSNIPSRSILYFELPEEICETNRGKFYTIDGLSLHTLKIAYMLKSDVKEKNCEVMRKDVKDLQPAMEYFYDIKRPFVTDYFGSSFSIDNEIEDLYTAVKCYHEGQNYSPDIDVQHSCLQVQLRPYQTAAVKWMLHREAQLNIPSTELHPLYIPITTKCGTVLYLNSYFGFLVHERPTKSTVSGGILADEMGLGKTVEVLSCMLANPRKDLPIEEETIKVEENTTEFNKEMNDSVEDASASENSGNPVEDVEMADISIKDVSKV